MMLSGGETIGIKEIINNIARNDPGVVRGWVSLVFYHYFMSFRVIIEVNNFIKTFIRFLG